MGNCNEARKRSERTQRDTKYCKHQELNNHTPHDYSIPDESDNDHSKQFQLFLDQIPQDYYFHRFRFYLREKRTNLYFKILNRGEFTRIDVGYIADINKDVVWKVSATLSTDQISVTLDDCPLVIQFVKQKDLNSQYPDVMLSIGRDKFARYNIKSVTKKTS
jgi:hypothetical protein